MLIVKSIRVEWAPNSDHLQIQPNDGFAATLRLPRCTQTSLRCTCEEADDPRRRGRMSPGLLQHQPTARRHAGTEAS